MKKLLVLSVLLGLLVLPVFASDFTFGGDATFGFIGDFGDNEAETMDLTFDIMAAIDDYSSLTINMDGLENMTPGSTVGISQALVATDVGAWLGLPVGLVVIRNQNAAGDRFLRLAHRSHPASRWRKSSAQGTHSPAPPGILAGIFPP